MATSRIGTAAPRRTTISSAVVTRTRKPTASALRARQAVFELSPLMLRSHLDSDWREEETEGEDEQDDLNADDDADIDERDVDEPQGAEQQESDFTEAYTALLGAEVTTVSQPVLDLSDIYTLKVVGPYAATVACRFEPPEWWTDFRRGPAATHFSLMTAFLHGSARWLEEYKQDFLGRPDPKTYVSGEDDGEGDPVVLQKGFVRRVKGVLETMGNSDRGGIAGASEVISDQDFSRLKRHVWLLWPGFSMPIGTLFSVPYCSAWVHEVCVRRFGNLADWPKSLSQDFGAEDLKRAKRLDPRNRGPEETLRVLCDKVRLNAASEFRRLLDALPREQ